MNGDIHSRDRSSLNKSFFRNFAGARKLLLQSHGMSNRSWHLCQSVLSGVCPHINGPVKKQISRFHESMQRSSGKLYYQIGWPYVFVLVFPRAIHTIRFIKCQCLFFFFIYYFPIRWHNNCEPSTLRKLCYKWTLWFIGMQWLSLWSRVWC